MPQAILLPVKTPAVLLFVSFLTLAASAADAPRALPPGQLPNDSRLEPLKDLNGYFPFKPSATREAWEARAAKVRLQMQVALGLYPWPEKTPLHADIHGRIERDDYTVEMVSFESMPGFFVTGNLYRPKNKKGPFPGVLASHGHWPSGRVGLLNDADLQKELKTGQERFEVGGRSRFQSLCVQLARMGCVAFQFDMLGNSDSQQISLQLAHEFKTQRPEMNSRDNWGLYSPQAESRLQSVMGLQTWNSIRSLDFLMSLSDVDTKRIGCTGGSGGGTQTMILGALDPRVTAEFPAVMVSTAMQGGCTCENASLLRVGTGNVEFAALFGPKPLGMTCANDWTKEMPTKGYPELQKHFAMLGAPDNVRLWPLLQFGHNYNSVSREAIYEWFNKHLQLGLKEPVREQDYPLLQPEQLTVWDAAHPKPPASPDFERKLLHEWNEDAQRQLEAPAKFKKIAKPGWEALIGWTPGHDAKLTHEREFEAHGNKQSYRASIRTHHATDNSFDLPEITIEPAKGSGLTVLWLDERGKAGLFDANDDVRPEVCKLLDTGARVVGIDLFLQGEFLADGKPVTKTRRVKNPRESAAYTFGYSYSLFAQRVQDTLTALEFIHDPKTKCAIVALDGTGPIAAAARALAKYDVDAAIRTDGFRFANVTDLQDPNFLPGGAKYGDVPGLLALAPSAKLCVLGESDLKPISQLGGTASIYSTKKDSEAIDWLIKPAE